MAFSFLMPVCVLAADYSLAPEFNPICWRLDDCNKNRAFSLGKTAEELKGNKDGWIEGSDPCKQEGWGKCLPSGQTKTTIAFAGKRSFTDIGEFLKYNYNIGLGIAGILAVVMIVVAGIQWVTSGGNSEMISSAKKRIGGALIGLLIAYLSYTILNIVNPALINLRLPQVYMIRPINLVPQFCKDVEDASSTLFAKAAPKGQVVDKTKFSSDQLKKMEVKEMSCGDQYFVGGAAGGTCMGSYCAKNEGLCMPVTESGNTMINQPGCIKAQMVVRYTIDPTLEGYFKDKISWWSSTLEKNWLDDNVVVFWGVCELPNGNQYIGDKWEQWDGGDSGEGMQIKAVEKSSFNEYYLIVDNLSPTGEKPKYTEDFWNCNSSIVKGKLVGFVFKTEMAKTSVWFGGVDANFYSSPSYVGGWKSISKNGFISLEQLNNGIYFNSKLGTDVADYLAANSNTEPSKMSKDGESGQGPIKLFVGLEKK